VKTRVLVGIPTLNNPPCLARCLAAIDEATTFDDYDVKLLVADDCSTSENLETNKHLIHRHERLRNAGKLEMLMSQERSGIAKTWNRLVRHQAADVVVLMNDDIEVVPDWLDVLVYSVVQNPYAGMVGLNAYVGVTKDRAVPSHRHEYCEATLHDGGGELLSSFGPIFAFSREHYDRVQGFDERFFVFYEELDFGVRLALEQGLVNYIASYPLVFHAGGATLSEPKNLDAAAELAWSRELFMSKWGQTLDSLRARIASIHATSTMHPREWNTQIKVWR